VRDTCTGRLGISLARTSTRLGHLQTVREDHAHGGCVVTRAQRTVDRALRSEVGHGADKGWKFRVQAGLSPLGSRTQCALALAHAALAVLRGGRTRHCRKGMRAAPLPRCTVTGVTGIVSVPRVLGVPTAQPTAASVGARRGMGECESKTFVCG